MDEHIVKRLMTSVKCNNCGRNYHMRDIKVIGNHEEIWFLQVYCPSCHGRYLITAVIDQEKKLELVSDLTEFEFSKFKNSMALNADDVLDMHAFLKEFDGDFSRLFNYKRV